MIIIKNFYAGKLLALLALIIVSPSFANNISVSNVSLTGQNTAAGYTEVRFDISWENSWRTSSAPNNWDAAWIFVKYRVGSGTWNHATLKSTGHTAPAGSTISAPADNTGVFFYRDADGSGTFSKTGVKLRWDNAANGVGDDDVVDVKVFAIEMVYVPQGAFKLGMPTLPDDGHFYSYPIASDAYQIVGEGEITIGTSSGNLYYAPEGADFGDQSGPVPASFPKGYNAFYSMKYEVTQQQYVDFLNSLSRSQQASRTAVNADLASGISIVPENKRYVMIYNDFTTVSGALNPTDRNAIRCDAVIDPINPLTFYCDLNINGIGGDANDGQNIACNYISWADLSAYLDWVALRPMTEIEFEKVCRGPANPALNEYAWGSGNLKQTTGISNPGMTDEVSSNAGNVTFKNGGTGGPMRVGAYATFNSTRISSGSSYFGAMEMSGNTWERPISLGNTIGRSYTGIHGNGILSTGGDADVLNWPGTDAVGVSFRGGWWDETSLNLRVGDRRYAAHVGAARRARMGGRGVRTAN